MQFQQNTQYTNYDSKYYCRGYFPGVGGGVSDRDAQHCPLTGNEC